jgi:predicted transcriptional regulator of viral defense system
MRAYELENIDKLYLSVTDIAKYLAIKYESAKLTAFRYTQKKILIRLKKDLYILASRFKILTEEDKFRLANIIQTPSYISLTTALSYYQISTQQQRYYLESIAQKRTISKSINSYIFSYTIIKKNLYHSFELNNGFFIATPEKALFDAIYLTAIKKYNCDFEALNFKKLNKSRLDKIIKHSNKQSIQLWNKLCKIYKI